MRCIHFDAGWCYNEKLEMNNGCVGLLNCPLFNEGEVKEVVEITIPIIDPAYTPQYKHYLT